MGIDRNKLEQEAMRLLQKGQTDRALERYQTLLRDDTRDLRVRQKVADLSLKLGNHKDAERHLREIARALKGAGKDRRAIGVYKQLLRLQKGDWSLEGDLGECYLAAGFPTDARGCFQRVVDKLGRPHPDKAIPFQEKLVKLDPSSMPVRVRLGELFEAAGWGEKSFAHWSGLAAECRRLGLPDERARFLERALKLRDDDNAVRVEAAEARVDIGDYGGALGHLQRVAQEEPENARALALLGRALEGFEQRDKARQVWLAAAQVMLQQGDAPGRAIALRRALACGAEDPGLEAEVALADRIAARFRLRLDEQSWAEPQTELQLRVVVGAATLARYGFSDRAVDCLEAAPAEVAASVPVQVALAERLSDAGRDADAIGVLGALHGLSGDAAAEVLTRVAVLEGRGAEPELDADQSADGGLIDDDALLEDELLDDELLDDEDTDDAPLPPGAALDDGLLDDELLDDELIDDDPRPMVDDGLVEDTVLASLRAPPGDAGLPDLDGSFFDEEPSTVADIEPAPDFSDIFGGPLTAAAPSTAARASTPAEFPAGLDDVRALLLVGALDRAEAALVGARGLGAAILHQQILLRRGKPNEALDRMRDAVDDAAEGDPLFKDALFALSKLSAEAGKLRGALRLLDEIEDLDSSWRTDDVALVRRGVGLLRQS